MGINLVAAFAGFWRGNIMPITIIQCAHDEYRIVCDNCKIIYGTGEFSANGVTVKNADEVFKHTSWRQYGNLVFCPTCVSTPQNCPTCKKEVK